MTLSALGYVPPVLAAAMHTAGSLIVVFNSARLVRKGEELEHYQPEPAAPTAAAARRARRQRREVGAPDSLSGRTDHDHHC